MRLRRRPTSSLLPAFLLGLLACGLATGPRAPDAGPTVGREVPEGAVLAALPFLDRSRTQRVTVDLAPEGSVQPFPLILDTGAQWSVLTPRVARNLGVHVRRARDRPYRRETRLGRDLQFWVDTRSSDTGGAYREVGVLGGQFLSAYVVEIDYDLGEVRFLDPDRYAVPEEAGPGEAVVPFRLVAHRPFVEVGVDEHDLRMLLNTGVPWTFSMRADEARELGMETRSVEWLRAGGVLGPVRTRFAIAPRLRLGDQGFEEVPFVALESDYNQAGPDGAVIGHDLLAQFVVRIDYPRRRLWLRRVESRRLGFLGYDAELAVRTGAFAKPTPEAGYEVEFVLEGEPAARLGLREGHRLPLADADTERDGLPVLPADPGELAAQIEAGGPVVAVEGTGLAREEIVLAAEPADAAADPGPTGRE